MARITAIRIFQRDDLINRNDNTTKMNGTTQSTTIFQNVTGQSAYKQCHSLMLVNACHDAWSGKYQLQSGGQGSVSDEVRCRSELGWPADRRPTGSGLDLKKIAEIDSSSSAIDQVRRPRLDKRFLQLKLKGSIVHAGKSRSCLVQ
jgi:hypothetical protein